MADEDEVEEQAPEIEKDERRMVILLKPNKTGYYQQMAKRLEARGKLVKAKELAKKGKRQKQRLFKSKQKSNKSQKPITQDWMWNKNNLSQQHCAVIA